MSEPIYLTKDGPIATVVFNRPENTEDFRIGYRAFLAKTTPAFVGR